MYVDATTIIAIIPPARSQRLAAASKSGCVAGKPSEERTGHPEPRFLLS